ncbi:MAG: hypothetical protein MPK05_02185 [Gammaproteobacteria bacterium]|nr:hypothetical protein [Gammaproteobacteria bacterium]
MLEISFGSFSYEKIIGQLDLALDQLAHHDADLDRFALMLVDNAVEIALHKHVGVSIFVNKNTQGDFKKEVRYAKKTKIISPETEESINFLHKLRNSSYHRGLPYTGVIHSLTVFYFKIACTLLQDHKPYSMSRDLELPYRAAKYLGDVPLPDPEKSCGYEEYFGVAWERLIKAADALRSDLLGDLVRDMSKTIDETDKEIERFASFPNTGRKKALKRVRATGLACSDEGEERGIKLGFAESEELADLGDLYGLIDFLMAKGEVSGSDPIPNWKNRLRSLEKEKAGKDLNAAIKKYFTFMQDTESFRDAIDLTSSGP